MLSLSQQKFLTSLHVKKYRQKYRKFIVEGDKLVAELLGQRRIGVSAVYGLDDWALTRAGLLQPFLEKFVPVSAAELKKISALVTPNQVLAVAELPGAANFGGYSPRVNPSPDPSPEGEGGMPSDKQTPLPFGGGVGGGVDTAEIPQQSLYLDAIQDPGNLGAILRVADWFGLAPVFCSPDCVDAYSPKVVQAGMGAVLRVPVFEIALDELLAILPGRPVLGAVLDGENVFKITLPSNGLLVIGNEGRGISPAVAARLTHRLTIPRPAAGSGAESLNAAVAAGILAACWASVREMQE